MKVACTGRRDRCELVDEQKVGSTSAASPAVSDCVAAFLLDQFCCLTQLARRFASQASNMKNKKKMQKESRGAPTCFSPFFFELVQSEAPNCPSARLASLRNRLSSGEADSE